MIYYCKFRIKAKRKKDNFSVQTQPFPIFYPQNSTNNLTSNDYNRHFANRPNNFENKNELIKSNQFDQKILNSNREASFYERWNKYKRTKGKDINTSSFYDSPVTKRKRKNRSGSERQNRKFKVKKQSIDSDEEN